MVQGMDRSSSSYPATKDNKGACAAVTIEQSNPPPPLHAAYLLTSSSPRFLPLFNESISVT